MVTAGSRDMLTVDRQRLERRSLIFSPLGPRSSPSVQLCVTATKPDRVNGLT